MNNLVKFSIVSSQFIVMIIQTISALTRIIICNLSICLLFTETNNLLNEICGPVSTQNITGEEGVGRTITEKQTAHRNDEREKV